MLRQKTFFELSTDPLGWVVNRTSKHFTWLREVLCKSFPGIYVPPRPPKRYLTTNSAKQKYFLEKLIAEILETPLFRASPFVVAFLRESDNNQFKSLRNETKKLKKPLNLEQNWSMSGQLICDSYLDKEKSVGLKEFLMITKNARKKIKRKTDGLVNKFKEISKDLYDISVEFENLEQAQKQYPMVRYR